MWPKRDHDFDPRPRWQRYTQRALTIGLVLAGFYLVVVFVQRSIQPDRTRKEAKRPLPLSPDYWVYVPKSDVRSLADVRDWVGKPLWVREGYRYQCTPGPETLGPMERLVPLRAYERSGNVWLEFDRRGKKCGIQVSAAGQFFLDEIFLIRDPREIYKDWSPQVWKKIEERRIETGMTETQIVFILGVGVLNRELSQPGDSWRVMEYTGGDRHWRVSYEYGVARAFWPLP
jgi:hypothetical protein